MVHQGVKGSELSVSILCAILLLPLDNSPQSVLEDLRNKLFEVLGLKKLHRASESKQFQQVQ